MSELQSAIKEMMRLLARKGYFEIELQEKLVAKGFAEEEVRSALQYGREKGYLNDGERLSRWIQRELGKGIGVRGVIYKMKQKNLIHLLTSDVHAWMAEEEKKGLSNYLSKKKIPDKQRVTHLLRKGYSYETIRNLCVSGEMEYI